MSKLMKSRYGWHSAGSCLDARCKRRNDRLGRKVRARHYDTPLPDDHVPKACAPGMHAADSPDVAMGYGSRRWGSLRFVLVEGNVSMHYDGGGKFVGLDRTALATMKTSDIPEKLRRSSSPSHKTIDYFWQHAKCANWIKVDEETRKKFRIPPGILDGSGKKPKRKRKERV